MKEMKERNILYKNNVNNKLVLYKARKNSRKRKFVKNSLKKSRKLLTENNKIGGSFLGLPSDLSAGLGMFNNAVAAKSVVDGVGKVLGVDTSVSGIMSKGANLLRGRKAKTEDACDTISLIDGQQVVQKPGESTLKSMLSGIFGEKKLPTIVKGVEVEDKKLANSAVATFLKPAIAGMMASAGVVMNNPVTSAAVGRIAYKLASEEQYQTPILQLMNQSVDGFKNAAGIADEGLNTLIGSTSEKNGLIAAKSYAGFKNYLDTINNNADPTGPVDSIILDRYKNNITRAYKVLKGYDKQTDQSIIDQEREIIQSGYKQFSELQWLAAVGDIETEINKPKYDIEEDNEFKKKLYTKMVAAFCNKTAQLSLNDFEISFKNDVIFSHDPCDHKKFEHLGKLLSLSQYTMLFSLDNTSNTDILSISNLPMKVFSYKLWYLTALQTNYNPYVSKNIHLMKILPTFVIGNLNFFEDFYKIIKSSRLDDSITKMVEACSYSVDLEIHNPILKGLKTSFFAESLVSEQEKKAKTASVETMKFCFEAANIMIESLMGNSLNDWNIVVTLAYCLKVTIYIYLFALYRHQHVRSGSNFSISYSTKWLSIIQGELNNTSIIHDSTFVKLCQRILLLSKINQVLEQEGIKIQSNYDIVKKKDIIGGKENKNLKKIKKTIKTHTDILTKANTSNRKSKILKGGAILTGGGGEILSNDAVFKTITEVKDSTREYLPVDTYDYCLIYPESGIEEPVYTKELLAKINNESENLLDPTIKKGIQSNIKNIIESINGIQVSEEAVHQILITAQEDFDNYINTIHSEERPSLEKSRSSFQNIMTGISQLSKTIVRQVKDQIDHLSPLNIFNTGGDSDNIGISNLEKFNNLENELEESYDAFTENILNNNLQNAKKVIDGKFDLFIQLLETALSSIKSNKDKLETKESAGTTEIELEKFKNEATLEILDSAKIDLEKVKEELESFKKKIEVPDRETQNKTFLGLIRAQLQYNKIKRDKKALLTRSVLFGQIRFTNKGPNVEIPTEFSVLVYQGGENEQKNLVPKNRIQVIYPENLLKKYIDIPKEIISQSRSSGGMESSQSKKLSGNLLEVEEFRSDPIINLEEQMKTKEQLASLDTDTDVVEVKKTGIGQTLGLIQGVEKEEGHSVSPESLSTFIETFDPIPFDPTKYWYLIYNGNIPFDIVVDTSHLIKETPSESPSQGVTPNQRKDIPFRINTCDTLVFEKKPNIADTGEYNSKEIIEENKCIGILFRSDENKDKKKIFKFGLESKDQVPFGMDLQLIAELNNRRANPQSKLPSSYDELSKLFEMAPYGSDSSGYDFSSMWKLFQGLFAEVGNPDTPTKTGGMLAAEEPAAVEPAAPEEVSEQENQIEIKKDCNGEIFLKIPRDYLKSLFTRIWSGTEGLRDKSYKVLQAIIGYTINNIIIGIPLSIFNLIKKIIRNPGDSFQTFMVSIKSSWTSISDNFIFNAIKIMIETIIKAIMIGIESMKGMIGNATSSVSNIVNKIYALTTAKVANIFEFSSSNGGQQNASANGVSLPSIVSGGKMIGGNNYEININSPHEQILVSEVIIIIRHLLALCKNTENKLQQQNFNDYEEELNSTKDELTSYKNKLITMIGFLFKKIQEKKTQLKTGKEKHLYRADAQTEQDPNDSILNVTYGDNLSESIIKKEQSKKILELQKDNLSIVLKTCQGEDDWVFETNQIQYRALFTDNSILKVTGSNVELSSQGQVIGTKEKSKITINKNKIFMVKEQIIRKMEQLTTDISKIKNEIEIERNKIRHPIYSQYIKGDITDTQLESAQRIDNQIQTGFQKVFQEGFNDSTVQKIRQRLQSDISMPIFENLSHLDAVRSFSSNFLQQNSVPQGRTPFTTIFSMVMIASKTRTRYDNSLDNNLQENYKQEDQIELLEQIDSRGFRSFEWAIVAAGSNLLSQGGSILKNLASNAISQIGVELGQNGISKAINTYTLDILSNWGRKMTDKGRSKHYYPALENLFGTIEKISDNEFIIRIINESDLFFADFNNSVTKPVIKVQLLGNKAIYKYVTVNLNVLNPNIRKTQEGMQVYYFGDNQTRLPWEPDPIDRNYLECEVLFYPIRIKDLVERSRKYDDFNSRIWAPVFSRVLSNYDPSLEVLRLNELLSKPIENINLNILEVLSKPSINTITDINNEKNLTKRFDLLTKQILESVYSYRSGNLYGELLRFIITSYNSNYKKGGSSNSKALTRTDFRKNSRLLLAFKDLENGNYNEIYMIRDDCLITLRVFQDKSRMSKSIDIDEMKRKALDELINDKDLKGISYEGLRFVFSLYCDSFSIEGDKTDIEKGAPIEDSAKGAKDKTKDYFTTGQEKTTENMIKLSTVLDGQVVQLYISSKGNYNTPTDTLQIFKERFLENEKANKDQTSNETYNNNHFLEQLFKTKGGALDEVKDSQGKQSKDIQVPMGIPVLYSTDDHEQIKNVSPLLNSEITKIDGSSVIQDGGDWPWWLGGSSNPKKEDTKSKLDKKNHIEADKEAPVALYKLGCNNLVDITEGNERYNIYFWRSDASPEELNYYTELRGKGVPLEKVPGRNALKSPEYFLYVVKIVNCNFKENNKKVDKEFPIIRFGPLDLKIGEANDWEIRCKNITSNPEQNELYGLLDKISILDTREEYPDKILDSI